MSDRLPPRTRYQGSKRKLLSWMDECIGNRRLTSVLDLMSGTGSVSYHFKTKGCRVASNDYLKCNYLTAVAIVENSSVTLDSEDIEFLLKDPEDDNSHRFVRDNFQGVFFTDTEDIWIDRRIARIEDLARIFEGSTLKYKQALAFHVLSQAALMKRPFNLFHRRNLYLRTSEVERSFGNKTTWETPFDVLFRRLCDETNGAIFSNGTGNIAYNEPAETLKLPHTFDAVYLDPPYFAERRERARSDYRFLYHFLEGLARYREWPELVDRNDMRYALRRDYNELSPYRVRPSELSSTLLAWFRSTISRWKDSMIVMSYKSPGIPTAQQLEQLVREFKDTVTIYENAYTYALSKRNGKPHENIELLIVGE